MPIPPAGSVLEPDVDVRDFTLALSRTILGYALLLGVAADALLRDGPVGLGFPIFIVLLALAATSLVWSGGRSVPIESRAWLITACVFSAGLAWRDSGTLQFLDFLATIGAITMAGIALRDDRAALLAERLRDTLWAAAGMARSIVQGLVPLAMRTLAVPETRSRWSQGARPALRAAIIGGALLVVFGSLLRGADPIFASLVSLPELDAGVLASHLVVIGVFGWVIGGWAREALLTDARRTRAPDALPFGLGALEITTALGTLTALFALFVLAQLGWFFGGEQFLRERTGLTAAQYARQGFFQTVWVVLLVVPVLMATRAAMRPGRELARRHTALSLPVIALLGAIILSAVMRMRLYVHFYGLTTDRLFPLVFMGWLAFVLVWFALTVLRDAGRAFVAGTAISGLLVLAALNAVAPDAIVARVNIARAARTSSDSGITLDLPHLAGLSGEAAALATSAVLAAPAGARGPAGVATDDQRCQAAVMLLGKWGPHSRSAAQLERDAAWRTWNAGDAQARAIVARHASELRAVQRAVCKRPVRR